MRQTLHDRLVAMGFEKDTNQMWAYINSEYNARTARVYFGSSYSISLMCYVGKPAYFPSITSCVTWLEQNKDKWRVSNGER